MGICAHDLRELINRVLWKIPEWYSDDAVELLMLTACTESDCGKYLQQINGVALGIFQIEVETMIDIYENWLSFRPDIADKVATITGISEPNELALEGNIVYGILLSRIMYLRAPGKLPKKYDVKGMAEYYVKWFNRSGKAKVSIAADKYLLYDRD